jgi:hypothetical protein
MAGKQSLSNVNPGLAREWHSVANGALVPDNVTVGSNRTVWWLCFRKHEWQASIASRSAGSGCPYCSSRRVGYGNDLASLFPSVAAEWHPTLNEGKSPHDFMSKSNAHAWWRGRCGHDWRATIANRTSRGSACPYCANQAVGYGNDLSAKFPAIAQEWHPVLNESLMPDQVTAGARKNVWWICPQGHEWRAMVFKRTNGAGCGKCQNVGRSILEMQVHQELLAVFASLGWTVEHDVRLKTGSGARLRIDILCGIDLVVEIDGSYWHKGKEARDRAKTQKLEAAGFRVIRVREQPLRALSRSDVEVPRSPSVLRIAQAVVFRACEFYPEIACELPSGYLTGDSLLAEAAVSDVHGHVIARELGVRSLAQARPDIAAEWHHGKNGVLTPETTSANSGLRVWWRCQYGHEYVAAVDTRNSKGTGCGFCSGRYVTPSTSLAAVNPELARFWHPTLNSLGAHEVTPHSRKLAWWNCVNGHITQDSPADRSKGIVCRQCPNSRRRKKAGPANVQTQKRGA